MIKICVICGKEFKTIRYASQQKCCSPECSKINLKQTLKKYRQTDKHKSYHRKNMMKHRKTNTFKTWLKKYSKTEECKNTVRKYRNSDKGKLFFKLWRKTKAGKLNNFRKSLKRRARHNHYIETYTEAEWQQKLIATNGICPGFEVAPHYVGLKYLDRDHIYSVKRASEDFQRNGIKRVYTINDMQPLCRCCNGRKQDRLIEQILVPVIIEESNPKDLNTTITYN